MCTDVGAESTIITYSLLVWNHQTHTQIQDFLYVQFNVFESGDFHREIKLNESK